MSQVMNLSTLPRVKSPWKEASQVLKHGLATNVVIWCPSGRIRTQAHLARDVRVAVLHLLGAADLRSSAEFTRFFDFQGFKLSCYGRRRRSSKILKWSASYGVLMEQQEKDIPPGIQLLKTFRGTNFSISFYKASVLGITFVAYACYHATRKPISIVKSVLHPEVGILVSHVSIAGPVLPPSYFASSPGSNSSRVVEAGWAPFIGKRGKARLGIIDVAFLASYALGMYFAGHLGDRLNLRIFLTVGMIGSAVFVCLFGTAYWWEIHSLSYFIFIQILAGIFQATGWPSVVTVVANWFDKSKRGVIMGIWNCHTSVGNIIGSLLAADVLQHGWGWSFVVPGLFMGLGAVLVFLFLVVEPADVVAPSTNAVASPSRPGTTELTLLKQPHSMAGKFNSVMIDSSFQDLDINGGEGEEFKEVPLSGGPLVARNESAIGFLEAWMIPGVAQFALCLFFSKLVAYTFLYWLPFYIRHTKIAGDYLSDKMAGRLSTLFDVGGMVGGIVAGYVSDHFNAKATTAAMFLYIAIPALVLYRAYGSISLVGNILLMMLLGMFINGPYALITTAVSADLGTHSSLNGNSKALATVTAIIDGTGSVGAAVGPLVTGFLSEKGWNAVFTMLIVSVLIAGLLLSKLVGAELMEKYRNASRTPFQRLGRDDVPDQ